jgi:hypothetical protein
VSSGPSSRPTTPEQAFLLRAIGGPPDSGPDSRLAALAPGLDWDRLLQTAPTSIRPYLAHCLGRRLPEAVPSRVREALERARRANAARHLLRQRELGRVLGALAAADVPVVVLKGMALAHTAYPDPSTRAMLDIDLLVPEDRWQAARGALIGVGLRVPARWAVRPVSGPNARPEQARPFERPGTGVLVELHTVLESGEPPFTFPTERAWERGTEATLGGLRARVLHPEDALVHVVLHLSSAHRFQHGLRALLDVHLHLERHAATWDWPQLIETCRAGGAAGWMSLTLRLARDLFASPVPDGALDALPAPRALEELERLAMDQLWHAESVRAPPGIVSLAAAPRTARLALVLGRLNPWRREDLAGGFTPRGLLRGSATAAKRLLADIRTRVPLYLSAWGRGDLSRPRLRRAAELLGARERIGVLMDADVSEGERAPHGPAAGPGLPNPRTPGAGAR